MNEHERIQAELAALKPPKVCVTVPADQRDDELALIDYARAMNAGDKLTRYAVVELLDSFSKIEQECPEDCVTCHYHEACERLMEIMEVFG